MDNQDWIYMMEHMQHIQLFSRLNVRRKRPHEPLSSETLDILSRIAMAKEPMTPLMISRKTGLTKPRISKLIEELSQKGYLIKEQDIRDKRSYFLQITQEGKKELEHTYQYYLEPVYALRRNLGENAFYQLMDLIRDANDKLQETEKRENCEIL